MKFLEDSKTLIEERDKESDEEDDVLSALFMQLINSLSFYSCRFNLGLST
jgi:hypothetical protein